MGKAASGQMDWKTEQEWVIMRYFSEHFPEFPKGKLVKGESPDFRLWLSPKRFIGIELTQVHQLNRDSHIQCYLEHESALQQVSDTIRAKEEKIRLYQSDHPHQLWLIIFVDYSEADAIKLVQPDFRSNKIETSFDRIFLFDLDTHRAYEIT